MSVLHWGEGHGELVLHGDHVGGGKDKVGQEARRYSVLARLVGDGES